MKALAFPKVRRILCQDPNCGGRMRLHPPRILKCELCPAERVWERVPCIVPFCGRTFKANGWSLEEEVCCGKHWRTAPEELREQHAELRKQHRADYRAWEIQTEGSEAQAIAAGRCDASYALCHDLWLVIKARILAEAGVMG